jgi:hypothetical protein
MPTLTKTTKQWGKVDKGLSTGDVVIEGLSFENIDAVHARYFPHWHQRNFRRNFKDFASAFGLEQALSGARRQAAGQCKLRVCRLVC